MAQTEMTTAMREAFDYSFHQTFLRTSKIIRTIPFVTGQETYNLKYYIPVDLPQPQYGMKYDWAKLETLQYTELENPPTACWYDFEINDVDLKILSQTPGMEFAPNVMASAARGLDQSIAKTIYQGNTLTGMSGLIAKAGNNDTTASAINTAPNLMTVMAAMKALIFADGFNPPYVCVLSDGMQVAWDKPINAAPVGPYTQGDGVRRLMSTMNDGAIGTENGAKFIWERNGASSGNDIKPLPAADNDDSVALVMKPVQDGQTAFTGVWCQPIVSTDWKFDAKANRWHTRIKCKVGLKVWDVDSICKHTDIDHA
jgi:hypothetical protein